VLNLNKELVDFGSKYLIQAINMSSDQTRNEIIDKLEQIRENQSS